MLPLGMHAPLPLTSEKPCLFCSGKCTLNCLALNWSTLADSQCPDLQHLAWTTSWLPPPTALSAQLGCYNHRKTGAETDPTFSAIFIIS